MTPMHNHSSKRPTPIFACPFALVRGAIQLNTAQLHAVKVVPRPAAMANAMPNKALSRGTVLAVDLRIVLAIVSPMASSATAGLHRIASRSPTAIADRIMTDKDKERNAVVASTATAFSVHTVLETSC